MNTNRNKPVAPKSVRLAVIGIFILAALNLSGLEAVFDPNFHAAIDHSLHKWLYNPGGAAVTATQVETARFVILVVVGILSVAVAVLLVWLGRKTRAGRRWARIAVTVILTLGLLTGLRSLSHERTVLDALVDLVQLVVHVAVLGLLWLPTGSRDHFRGPRPAS